MASPFNVPDEFVRGFYKSGQNLVHAFAGLGGASPGKDSCCGSQILLVGLQILPMQPDQALTRPNASQSEGGSTGIRRSMSAMSGR